MKKPLIVTLIILGIVGIVVLNVCIVKAIWESNLPVWLKVVLMLME